MTRTRAFIRASIGLLPVLGASTACLAQHWEIMSPGTTGIPGEEVRLARFAPNGDLWVAARWPFWGDGGIGVYDFKTEVWTVHSNVDGRFPSAFVNDIEFAADGTVWAATSDGLAHYESGEWEVYTSANSPMPYHEISAIDLDSKGRVWMNVRRGGAFTDSMIFVFDGETWRSWSASNGIPWSFPRMTGMFVDSEDHVWVGNAGEEGLAEFDGVTWRIHTDPAIGTIGGVIEDHSGHLWALSRNSSSIFYRYDRQDWEVFSPANTPFRLGGMAGLTIDRQGRVLVSNQVGQVIRQSAAGSSTFDLIADIGVRASLASARPNGDIWLTSPGAVRHLDGGGTQLRAFNTYNTGVPDYVIDNFDLDSQGYLWVATGEGGISRFDGERWRNWGNHNAGSEPYPWAGSEPMGGFYLDSQGRGWMGGNGIGLWAPSSGQFHDFWDYRSAPYLGTTLFKFFAEDMTGAIFTATKYGSVYRLENGVWIREAPSNEIWDSLAMESDHRGHVFVAKRFDIWEWDGREWATLDFPPGYLDALGGITTMTIADDGTLWVGTNGGLVRYDGSFALFDTGNSPLPAKQVQGIDIATDGRMAVSAHEFGPVAPFPSGVAVIDGDPANPAHWTIYRYGPHLPHYQLGPVIFDADGDLWVSALTEGAAVLRGERPCYPDCTGDQVLDIFDFLCFQDAFVTSDPYADCDGSTVFDIFDFLCFQDAFVSGCP